MRIFQLLNKRMFINILKFLLLPSIIILIWQSIYTFNIFSKASLPSPYETMVSFFSFIFENKDNFWSETFYTLFVTLTGFIFALLGISIGLYIGYKNSLRNYVVFVFEFGRALPAVAILSPIMLIAGTGFWAKILLVGFGVFFLSAVGGLESPQICSSIRISYFKMLGANNLYILKIIFRESLGKLLTIIRISVSVSLILSVVSEMLIGNQGLGKLLIDYKNTFKPDNLWAIVLFLGTLGYLINFILIKIQKKSDDWR